MLTISLLGEIVIQLNGTPLTHFRSQKEIALLAYLAHTGQTHNREAVADLLWEARSSKQSLSNLRTVLARVRKQVGENLVVTRKTVAIAPAIHEQVDSVRFQAMVSKQQLKAGLDLYAGDFMPAFYLPDAPRFNDWLVVEQERLRQRAGLGFRQLAAWQEEQGDFSTGILTAQCWLNLNPFDETAVQQLMRLLTFDGRVSEALAVYEKCRHLLQTELTLPPSPTTIALHKAIQDGSLPTPAIPSAPLHNLPRALTPLIGRQKEIEQLESTLLNPDYPLVSITGVGGIGKTSLALAVGRQIAAAEQHLFADGVWFISLAEIEEDSPEKVKNRVAALVGQAMDFHFHGESDLWSQLLGQLASKKLLLILDNIEQFLSTATDLMPALLEAGDGIHLLVTSRTSLALPSNFPFPLAGLATPTEVTAEAVQNESVRLFWERAKRTTSQFDLEKNLAEVAAICQFVEGVPLAIELAAASLGRLMLAEIMPALKQNLRHLETSQPELPPRQRTLHAIFDYSWHLLDAREQILLAQISIFRGGFTRQAAEAILNEPNSGLYTLQHHALLSRDEIGRFRMHSLLRQLAHEKLSNAGMSATAEQAANHHALYFTDFIAGFADELQRGEGQAALQSILPEQANLRVAWQYAIRTGQWSAIGRSLDGYHRFYQRKALFSEENNLLNAGIESLQSSMEPDDVPLTALLARLLTARAWGYLHAAAYERGVKTAERVCEMTKWLGQANRPSQLDTSHPKKFLANIEAEARVVCSRILTLQVKRETALNQLEQVVTLAKTAQNPYLEADGWSGIGSQMLYDEDVTLAEEPLHRALNLCQTHGYQLGELITLILLGGLAHRLDDAAQSLTYFEQAIQLSRTLGNVATEAEALGSAGVILAGLGDLSTAQTMKQEALATYRRLNMPESELWMLSQLGLNGTRIGDYVAAVANVSQALAIAERINDNFWQAKLEAQLGTIWSEQGESKKAVAILTDSYQTAQSSEHPRLQAMIVLDWGMALLAHGSWLPAQEKFQETYDFWLEARLPHDADALSALAGLAFAAWKLEMPGVAATHADNLWTIYQDNPDLAARANLKLYWLLGMVWQGLGDSRAEQVWEKARALLQERSEKIEDEETRQMFLQKVPAHRAIKRHYRK